jgi:hypothetical protein
MLYQLDTYLRLMEPHPFIVTQIQIGGFGRYVTYLFDSNIY